MNAFLKVFKEYGLMSLGMLLYSFGWIGCILPVDGTGGGAAGLSLVLCALIRNLTGFDIPVGTMAFAVNGILLLAAPWFYSIWIGRSVTVSPSISVSVAVYTLLLMLANIYMYLINGTGKVRIQLIIYLTFAIISYPIMNFSCARWGIPGLLIVPATVYLCQALLGRIQLHRLINNTATGLWNK